MFLIRSRQDRRARMLLVKLNGSARANAPMGVCTEP
jgi:hypothetical protein